VFQTTEKLDFAHAAALPLTTITAWELLFDRFGVSQEGKTDVGTSRRASSPGGH
jgi:NADPH:quinone reductase